MDKSVREWHSSARWCRIGRGSFVIIATGIATAVGHCYELPDLCRSGEGLWAKLKPLYVPEKSELYRSSWNEVRAVLIEFDMLESEADVEIRNLLFPNLTMLGALQFVGDHGILVEGNSVANLVRLREISIGGARNRSR